MFLDSGRALDSVYQARRHGEPEGKFPPNLFFALPPQKKISFPKLVVGYVPGV